MLRKALAGLLIVLWVILSGLDLLEDLDLAGYAKLCSAKRPSIIGLGQATKVANDTFENAYRTPPLSIEGLYPPVTERVLLQPTDETKFLKEDFKIYKFHGAFLL